MPELTMVEALNTAIDEEMDRDETVMVLGEDVGEDGGIFRVTKGLLEKYGEDRIVDTPLAECGIVGTSVGLAMNGMRPLPEAQFSGFSYQAFHHLEQHAARMRKRSRGRYSVPLTLRMPYGAGVHALEHHSESRETYWIHTPGLKTVIPRSPRKAYTLLKASVRDPDPVIFLEPKALYRKFREEVPTNGEADLPDELLGPDHVREGDDVTVVAFGHMFHRTEQVVEELAGEGVEADLFDLEVVGPLHTDPIIESVKRTGRCVVVQEAHKTLGVGSEITARINDEALLYLEAPVGRVTAPDVWVPYFAREQAYMPDQTRIRARIEETLEF